MAAEAGMKGLILTAKHHDGFCLWPSAYTRSLVSIRPARGGQGDVVRELRHRLPGAGIAFGVYLSPWDRNHRGMPARTTLPIIATSSVKELLSNYGPLFEGMV